jgi:hypothetical protein
LHHLLGLQLEHATKRSAGIEVTPAVVITRRDAPAEALIVAHRQ